MTDTFVDLAYRGVSLARRVKLAQVRPAVGYLETPAPMPVGSTLALMADDGTAFDAVVTGVHEQISGATAVPGMAVAPALASDAAKAWWGDRVTLPAEDPPTERIPRAAIAQVLPAQPPAVPVAVAPRSTAPMPAVAPPAAASSPAADTDIAGASVAAKLVAAARSSSGTRPPPVAQIEDDHSRRTTVMDAVSVEVLAEMSVSDSGSRLIDDGKKTEMMAAIDISALGLEPSSSVRMSAVPEPVDDDSSEPVDPGDPSKPPERPSSAGASKRKRKKR